VLYIYIYTLCRCWKTSTDILFFTLVDTVLHSVACVRSWKAPSDIVSNGYFWKKRCFIIIYIKRLFIAISHYI